MLWPGGGLSLLIGSSYRMRGNGHSLLQVRARLGISGAISPQESSDALAQAVGGSDLVPLYQHHFSSGCSTLLRRSSAFLPCAPTALPGFSTESFWVSSFYLFIFFLHGTFQMLHCQTA